MTKILITNPDAGVLKLSDVELACGFRPLSEDDLKGFTESQWQEIIKSEDASIRVMTKIEKRKEHIKNLMAGINAAKKTITTQRAAIVAIEDKLENKRAELQYQRMLLKFDEIDQLRQEISDAIANK